MGGISVVVPTHNMGAYIAGAVQSILEQSLPPVEIIVVDDGSTDDTATRVRDLPVRYIRLPHRGAPGAVRNSGIAASSGEFIAFLDADDVMAGDRLARSHDLMTSDPRIGLAVTDYRNFTSIAPSETTHFQSCSELLRLLEGRESLVLPPPEGARLLARENFTGAGLMMVRREMLSLMPAFPEDLRVGEDFVFAYRAARAHAIGIVNRVGIQRRLHSSNITRAPVRYLRDSSRAKEILRATETDPDLIKSLDQAISRAQLAMAHHVADEGSYALALKCAARSLGFNHRMLVPVARSLARTVALAAGLKKVGGKPPAAI